MKAKTGNGVGLVALAMMVAALLGTGCGSSSDTAATTTTGTTGVGNTVAVDDLSKLPNLNLSGVDTASANFSAPLGKSVADGQSTAGQTSEPGCMAIKFFKPKALAELKKAEQFKCYIETLQDGASEFKIPNGSTADYLIQRGGPDQKDSGNIRIRVGNANGTDSTTFGLQWCEQTSTGAFAQNGDFQVTGNTATKTWGGFLTEHYSDAFGSGFFNTSFSIVMKAADDLSEEFDFNNVSSASAVSTFGSSPSTSDVESGTTYQEGFRLTFGYDAVSSLTGGPLNTTIGTFAQASGGTTGIIAAKFNSSVGAGKLSFVDKFFNYGTTEAFSVTANPPTVIAETGSSVSALFNDVDAQNLPSLTIQLPADVSSATKFTTTWNCEPATTFTEINALPFDFNACEKIEQEAHSEDDAATSLCFSAP